MPKKSDALLITDKSNIRYLSNFTGSSGFILLCKKNRYLFTDFRYIERAKDSIKKGTKIIDVTRVWRNPEMLKKNWLNILKKEKIRILGIEEHNLTVAQLQRFRKISKKIRFVNASGKMEEIREKKSVNEIKLIEKSQSINEKTFLEIKKIVQSKKAVTEIELAWKIREFGHAFGAEDVSFDPIVAFGKNSSRPHHEPGNTKLKKRDIVLIDMGMKYQGYCSDMTRMLFIDKPTNKQKEIYNLVLEAQEKALQNLKAGITGAHADKLSRDLIAGAGYGENYGHAGGHGIGLDIHEQPSLSENYKKSLIENSIITVEPGIYLPGEFGVRIEDMALIQIDGIKNLTKISKKL